MKRWKPKTKPVFDEHEVVVGLSYEPCRVVSLDEEERVAVFCARAWSKIEMRLLSFWIARMRRRKQPHAVTRSGALYVLWAEA